MAAHRQQHILSYPEQLIRDWIVSHRGILNEIAIESGVTPQFVQQVVYGKDKATHSQTRILVQRLAKERGWPGLKRRK